MRPSGQIHMLSADYVATISHLPITELQARGVRVLAFDLDHTLAHRRTRVLAPGHLEIMRNLRVHGFRLILASNSAHDLTALGASIDATVVRATLLSRKPLLSYYRRVIAAAGCHPDQIAMVGDRVINDIWGAKLAGLVTVKVNRLG
jgi:uncharacterized protein